MKNTAIVKLMIIASIMTLLVGEAYSQKVLDKASGSKPGWVTWTRGKTFKSLGKGRGKKIKINKDEEVYLFRAQARELANNGDKDVFSLDDTKRMTSLNASFELASIMKLEIDASVTNDVNITDEVKQRIFDRTEKMKSRAKFSGFTRVGSYWEKVLDKSTDKIYWEVHYLYSMNKPIFTENLEKAMKQLDIPDKAQAVAMAIETAAEEADIGDF